MAGQDDRPLRGIDEGCGLAHQFGSAPHVRPIARQPQADRIVVELGRLELDVLTHVDEHGAGPARAGDVERFLHRQRQFGHVLDQVVVLGDRQGHAGDVGFLECIRADQGRSDLAGDGDEGDRVHHRARQPGHQVRRARPGWWPCTRRPDPRPARSRPRQSAAFSSCRTRTWCTG